MTLTSPTELDSVAPDDTPSRMFPTLACIAVAVITTLTYLPSLSSDFVRLDDYQYVVDNELVRNPSGSGIRQFFSEISAPSTVEGYYQPLTMASLMLDVLLSGSPAGPIDPFVFHLTNVLLHAATSVLVFLLLHRVVGGVRVPLIFALVFALHPVQVESVAWISQRKTLLATALAVGSLLGYLAHASSPVTSDVPAASWVRRRWLVLALFLYVLANLAKPTVMLLPLVLPLLDRWPLGRRVVASLPEKWPFLIAMIAFGYIAAVSQTSAGQGAGMAIARLSDVDLLTRWLGLLSYNLMLYAGSLVWPIQLSPFRDIPADLSFANGIVVTAVLGTFCLLAIWLASYRRRPSLFVGFGAAAIMLSPALGPVRFMASLVADRFLYLPLIFLIIPLAHLVKRGACRYANRATLIRGAAAIWLLPLLIVTREQQAVWHDSKSLWTRVAQTAPSLDQAPNNLACIALEEARYDDAVAFAEQALHLNPVNSSTLHVLARAYVRAGHPDRALTLLDSALDIGLGPLTGAGHVARAEAYLCMGRDDEAQEACDAAIAHGFPPASCYAAVADAALRFARDNDRAAAFYRRSIEYDPDNVVVRWNYGTALEYAGRGDEALAQYEEVRRQYQQRGIEFPPVLSEAMQRLRRRLDRDRADRKVDDESRE